HPDNRAIDQPRYYTRQSALHAGDGNYHGSRPELLTIGQYPVNAGYPDIAEAVHSIAHSIGRYLGFFGHGNIGTSRAYHEHSPAALNLNLASCVQKCPGLRIVLKLRDLSDDFLCLLIL